MKYVDLSHEIRDKMPIYPGDMDVELIREKCYSSDGYNLYSFSSAMHAGTHIDSPLHMCDSKKFISEYPIDKFIGNVALLDVRGEKIIGIKEAYYNDIKENDIVILFTGWDMYYGKEEYYRNHPIVSKEFADLLVLKKIKMLGIDMPSPDREPFNIHKKLFENDIFILENLTNLKKLLYNDNIQLFAQPLKIDSEASLVRAVALFNGY